MYAWKCFLYELQPDNWYSRLSVSVGGTVTTPLSIRPFRLGTPQDLGVQDYCWNRRKPLASHPGCMWQHPTCTWNLWTHQIVNIEAVHTVFTDGTSTLKLLWTVALKWVQWHWCCAVSITGLYSQRRHFWTCLYKHSYYFYVNASFSLVGIILKHSL
jgi:hypothetical protein